MLKPLSARKRAKQSIAFALQRRVPEGQRGAADATGPTPADVEAATPPDDLEAAIDDVLARFPKALACLAP